MNKLTSDDYKTIAQALLSKGFKPAEVYPVLEEAGFEVEIKKTLYSGIYASRLIAVMYDLQGKSGKPLKL